MSFFTKRPAEDKSEPPHPHSKRPRTSPETLAPYPRRIIFWNCNGLSARLRADEGQLIREFIAENSPDILFLSEVRLPASHNAGAKKAAEATVFYRNLIRHSDSVSIADFSLVNNLITTPELENFKVYFSLANTKYAGTAMLLNTGTTQLPTSVRFNVEGLNVKNGVHDESGRVIVAKFNEFSILHTYSPNNGWTSKSLKRRREWDKSLESFMIRKKEASVQVIWCGDLNVAPTDRDLTDPRKFKKQNRPLENGEKRKEEDVGQPGCTEAERRRFRSILKSGELKDAYRVLRGADGNDMTWRGTRTGKFGSNGMRIDHAILSSSLVDKVDSIEVMGVEKERAGFMGSDHCPVMVVMKKGIPVPKKRKISVQLPSAERSEASTQDKVVEVELSPRNM